MHTKRIVVQLPEAERRRIKVLAASQGLTLQQAVHEAFEAWASQLRREGAPPLDLLPGPPAGADLEKPEPQAGADLGKRGRQERAAKPAQDKSRAAGARPASRSAGGQPRNLEGALLAWFRRAGTLDWSKCSAVQSVPAEIGNVWVVRGTTVPVAAIFRRFAEGQRFGEIAEALGLTQEQLKPVLEFAAEGGMFPRSAR